MTITICDAIKAQPALEREPGYTRWLAENDWDALDTALNKWGFSPTNNDGEIPIDV